MEVTKCILQTNKTNLLLRIRPSTNRFQKVSRGIRPGLHPSGYPVLNIILSWSNKTAKKICPHGCAIIYQYMVKHSKSLEFSLKIKMSGFNGYCLCFIAKYELIELSFFKYLKFSFLKYLKFIIMI